MHLHAVLAITLIFFFGGSAYAQQVPIPRGETAPASSVITPDELRIASISVAGVEAEGTQAFVLQAAGLSTGETILIPGDPALGDAIRNVYDLGLFSDVKIVETRRDEDGVHLQIRVQEEPRLANFEIHGVRNRHARDLSEESPLLRGTTVRPGDIERTKQIIQNYYYDRGYMLAEVFAQQSVGEGGQVQLDFHVERGPRVEVEKIHVDGNEEVSDRRIRRRMSNTKEDRWWRFWKSETFNREEYEEDLEQVIDYYNENGFYDAQIVSDSVALLNGQDPRLAIRLVLREGPQYRIRNVQWDGNTVYSDAFLTQALGFERGDVFDQRRMEQNLFGNRQSSDVASLYMNRGYMRFNLVPTISVAEGDSLDLHLDVTEGDVYEFGEINILGNTKTNEHVIRRELYTVPGQTFSREAITESIRRLSQLNYFTQESLAAGPGVDIDDSRRVVDLTYRIEEQGSDQLELSGTWGRFGLILMLRFSFNNFSTSKFFEADGWRPVPTGDGQRLSVGVQTNGTFYQSYSLSFTEPWFRGRPTPVGFSLAYSRFGSGGSRYFYGPYQPAGGNESLSTLSGSVFMERRLTWPDDKFSTATSLRYQYYNYDVPDSLGTRYFLPSGVSQVVALQQSLTRNSEDHPMFPMRGSYNRFSVEVSPPVSNFIQYHKWRFQSRWNVPMSSKIALGVNADYGYVGSLTGERVGFERFVVGGSPFDTQYSGASYVRDFIYMRGYPSTAIGPRFEGDAVGGTILNKYGAELRWMAVQSPQLSASPYLFAEAANTWDRFSTYNPSELYRSAGMGVRLFLPIVGMLELSYGYNFDEFVPVQRSQHDGSRRWFFQFTLGQGFNQ